MATALAATADSSRATLASDVSMGTAMSVVAGAAALAAPSSSVRRAAALRVKYAVEGTEMDRRRHVHPELLGGHPENRNGVGLNGSRCEELLRVVFKKWDDDTANHGSVCVQERPGNTTFLEYNRAKVAGDARLAALT